MLISRRKILIGSSALASLINYKPAFSWTHGVGAIPRVILAAYGQSNMNNMFASSDVNTPAANANTFVFDGTTMSAPPNANIRVLLNGINDVTGLPVITINCAVIGSGILGLSKGTAAYNFLISTVQALSPTSSDIIAVPFDQGEGDADTNPHTVTQTYINLLTQLASDLATDLGRTTSTCPLFIAALGNGGANLMIGNSPSGGNTQPSWQAIKNAHYLCSLVAPGVIYSHTNFDFSRLDDYHYSPPSTFKLGARLARSFTTYFGYTSGYPHWQISGGLTVSATQTNISVVHSLGTDFTASNGTGWEVTGDNGASWVAATSSRINSTTIQLTHASVSQTSARAVRYCYGLVAPDMIGNTLNPPSGLILDNSSLAVPLNPTVDDIRPTPVTVIPVPTWRDINTPVGQTGQFQTIPTMRLGPSTDNYQKLVIMTVTTGGPTVPSIIVKPNIGAQVAAPTPVASHGNMFIFQALLGVDANGATACEIDFDYGTLPFTTGTVQLYTVPAADLNSTTSTGQNGNSASAATTCTCTVNVSASGFIIACEQSSVTQTGFATIPSNYAMRWEAGTIYSADASNCSASASSSFSVTNTDAGTIDILMASWR